MLSIIIPAWNEDKTIDRCLASLVSQDLEVGPGREVEIIVVANACTDSTANIAREWQPRIEARGMSLHVVETPARGKTLALNLGDRHAAFASRLYLDADVELSPTILRHISEALVALPPRFVSGRFGLMPPVARTSRLFARVWLRMPFLSEVAPASGLYAVNASGRKRWDEFPDIISDDSYVRALFAPDERVQVSSTYRSPLAEGAWRIVRARRRQEVGIRQLALMHPGLPIRPAVSHSAQHLLSMFWKDPAGVLVYCVLTGWAKATAHISDGTWHSSR